MQIKPQLWRVLYVSSLLLMLSACQSVAYYSQSVVGHSRLMLARQPIDVAIKTASPAIAHKLRLSKTLRAFAFEKLALPNNNSYSSYVALKRDYPVWLVVAAPKYSLKPKQWCYWVIGCAAYRGYFTEESATRYAAELKKFGFDTYVTGASAYSTLGWFNDPLLPSMMQGSDAAFSELLFHELAHQAYYLNGDSAFNEAFATVVGEQGTLLWLRTQAAEQLPAYQQWRLVKRDFAGIIEQLKADLSKLYGVVSAHSSMASGHSAARINATTANREADQRKEQAWQTFRDSYRNVKATRWHDQGYYDGWVFAPMNNARLAAFSTYAALVPKFEALFHACDADFPRFYARVKQASKPLEHLRC